MNKRVIIVGKGGSGKDHLRKSLSEMGYKYCVSHTSRPPRQGEEGGVDYFFVSIEEVSDPDYLEKNFKATRSESFEVPRGMADKIKRFGNLDIDGVKVKGDLID
mgnify:CR=1 FL=1